MNVLVTGGFGFIGHHLVERLVFNGYKVIVYDAQTYACEYVNKDEVPNTWCILKTDSNFFASKRSPIIPQVFGTSSLLTYSQAYV